MLKNLINLIFPSICYGCHNNLLNNESILCTKCNYDLPQTYHYLIEENEVKEKFYGLLDIQFAGSLLYFHKKGIVQNLIHNLKYKGKEEIGIYLATIFEKEINEIILKHQIDTIIPIPLHPSKIKERGYNQILSFSKTIAQNSAITLEQDFLIRTKKTASQTFKNKNKRIESLNNAFEIQLKSKKIGRHILLVDDVITTGATIEECAKTLQVINNIKISVLSIAFTQS